MAYGNERLSYGVFPTATGRLAAGETSRNVGNSIFPADGVPVILGTQAARVTLRKQGLLVISCPFGAGEKREIAMMPSSRCGRKHYQIMGYTLPGAPGQAFCL